MKKFTSTVLFTAFSLISLAQTDGISYQAVITNNETQEIPGIDIMGNYLYEEAVDLRFTIYNAEQIIEYQELQSTVSDKFGMVNLVIGQGITTGAGSGDWNEIDWDGTQKKLVVELDFKGRGFVEFSSQDLLFVPYGYHRNIYANGTLEVDEETVLNSSLTVENQSLTTLTGDLIVEGSANFDGNTSFHTITVADWSRLQGTLSVGDSTMLNGPVHVMNAYPVQLSGSLNVEEPVTFRNSFEVLNQSPTALSGSLSVHKEVDLYDSLNVLNASPTMLSGSLSVSKEVDLFDSLNVLNASPSYLSGSLMVDGETNLGQTLNVNNASPVFLSGELNVDGISNFNDDANFQNINVEHFSNLYGPLTVHNQSPVDLSGSLQVLGESTFEDDVTTNASSFLNGQVTISAGLSGTDSNYDAYPLRVQGSGRGIAIQASASTPSGDNNFITFFNIEDAAIGRIEGETAAEKALSPEYIFETSVKTAEVIMATNDLIGASTSSTACVGLGACVTVPTPSLIIAASINLVIAGANLIAYQTFAFANLGVTFQSGSADYAEWLLRANPNEQMSYGDIVSVHGGKISRNTDFGDQMMVISFKPAVLGNMPAEGEEYLHEMVAFMGQVPVKVKGKVNIGDYILPGGMHDGFGRAVHPDDMQISDYKKIVGVAWSSSADEISSYVNVAIGMNRNDLLDVVADQQVEIKALQSELNDTQRVLAELLPGFAEKMADSDHIVKTAPAEIYEPEQELSAEEMHPPLDRSIFEKGMEMVREQFLRQGIDVNTHPVYGPIFNNPEAREKLIEESMQIFEIQRKMAIEIDAANGY